MKTLLMTATTLPTTLLFLLLLLFSKTTAYTSSPDHLLKTAHQFIATTEEPSTLPDALSQLTTLRQFLTHLLSQKEYKAPDAPSFLQQEREQQARVEEEEAKTLQRLEQQWEVDPNAQVTKTTTNNVPCTHHVSCDECLAHKCGWCIGARRCIQDIAWVCRGDHDHVGKVGKHDTCPTVESVEQARKEREALREAARIAYAPPSSSKGDDQETDGTRGTSDSSGDDDNNNNKNNKGPSLPRGTYGESCRDCVVQEPTSLHCLCTQPDGQELPSTLDYSTCDDNTHEVLNANGQLACGEMSLTRMEAQRRAKERLEQREFEELERVSNEMKNQGKNEEGGTTEDDSNNKNNDNKNQKSSKKKTKSAKQIKEDQHRRESVLKYVERSKTDSTRGAKAPYVALNVDRTATQSEIRKAYRTLTLLLHPDKNEPEMRDLAESAFREVVAAYEILSNPDKRAAFDDFGGNAEDDGGFESFWEYENSGKKDERDFYTGHRLITQLTEQLWDRRLVGDSIWLVEFYAPWCSHCQQLVSLWKGIAAELEETNIQVGAVNCEKNNKICSSWYDIPSYPTIMILNEKWGTQQLYSKNLEKSLNAIVKWSKAVAAEWNYLFTSSRLLTLEAANFTSSILNTNKLVVISFVDGFDCSSCKTAKTNMLRLSASLGDMATIGVVNCAKDEEARELCYTNQSLPRPPHSAMTKIWPRYETGNSSEEDALNRTEPLVGGELLYNSNEIESHIALQIVERTVRMTLMEQEKNEKGLSASKGDGFQKEKEDPEDDPPPPPPPPPPMWNGPERPPPIAWDSGGGGRRQQIAERI